MRRAKDLGISSAYFEAVAPTYEEAKAKALKGIKLSERDVRIKEVESTANHSRVRAISIKTRLDEAKRDLGIFLDGMHVKAEVKGREEAGLIFLDLEGENLGFLIGRYGSNLEAMEYLLGIIHNRRFTQQRHIILDIGGYRRKDIQYIERLLERAKQHISNRGRPFKMPPMESHLRKLTHLLISKYPGLSSKSVGEEPKRYVEVIPSKEEKQAEPEAEIEPEPEPEAYNTGREWDTESEGEPLY